MVHEEEDMPETQTPRPKEFGNATTAYVTASLNGYPVNALAHPLKRKNVPSQTQRGLKPTGREKQNKSKKKVPKTRGRNRNMKVHHL